MTAARRTVSERSLRSRLSGSFCERVEGERQSVLRAVGVDEGGERGTHVGLGAAACLPARRQPLRDPRHARRRAHADSCRLRLRVHLRLRAADLLEEHGADLLAVLALGHLDLDVLRALAATALALAVTMRERAAAAAADAAEVAAARRRAERLVVTRVERRARLLGRVGLVLVLVLVARLLRRRRDILVCAAARALLLVVVVVARELVDLVLVLGLDVDERASLALVVARAARGRRRALARHDDGRRGGGGGGGVGLGLGGRRRARRAKVRRRDDLARLALECR